MAMLWRMLPAHNRCKCKEMKVGTKKNNANSVVKSRISKIALGVLGAGNSNIEKYRKVHCVTIRYNDAKCNLRPIP